MLLKKLLFIFITSFIVVIFHAHSASSIDLQEVLPDREHIQYIGRIDWQNSQAPILNYPGTGFRFEFEGTNLQLKLAEDPWGDPNYISVYLDDNAEPKIIHLDGGYEPTVYPIANQLEDKVHSALVIKRNDYITGGLTFNGILIDSGKKLLPAQPQPKKKIEVYGDSISSGTVVEYELAGTPDPSEGSVRLSNAYFSFGAMLAREYQADYSLVAQAGIALADGYGFWHEGTGMEAVYDLVKPIKNSSPWNFEDYIPNLVIIALGQNDSSSIQIDQDLTPIAWKNRYKNFISNLRSKYPNAYFICMFPNMYHDPQWDNYLTEAVTEYKSDRQDNKIYSLITTQVTPGHPRISEQQAMTDSLKHFIDTTLVSNGFNW